uniref:Uncharacterized protein n=1 Tax=Oryza nivara TaxID=4536 RepID=A0A0E0FSW5_ORYNI
MYRGSCRARAWSESACGMFLLGWVPWPSWERTPLGAGRPAVQQYYTIANWNAELIRRATSSKLPV